MRIPPISYTAGMNKKQLDETGKLIKSLITIRDLKLTETQSKLMIVLELSRLGVPIDEQAEKANKLYNSKLFKRAV